MNRLRWLPVALIGALIAIAALTLSFSTFMIYDDEGYVLFSLKTFTEGGGLYSRVYSQYGPFFFLFNQALHFFGFEFTNTDGRLLTVVLWLTTASLGAALVWRSTRSTLATACTLGGVYLHLWPMTSEPSHPGGLIVFLTALLGWLGVRWAEQPAKLSAAAGAIGMALLLTKINVGVFAFAAAGAWWLLHLDDARLPLRWRATLIAAALAALPVALMAKIISRDWVATFALVAATSGVTVTWAAARGVRPLTHWRDLFRLAAAAVGLAAVTVIGIMLQGTSASALLEGVVLGPLKHPLAYTAPYSWHAGTMVVTALSFGLAAWVALAPSPRNLALVAVARVIVAAAYFESFLFAVPIPSDHFGLSYGLATLWLWVQPLGNDSATQPARTWLALLCGLQILHAFPVAGSQISWGSFLLMPLIAIGVHDLARLYAGGTQRAVRTLRLLTASVLCAATAVRCAQFSWLGYVRVRDSDSLQLPGAGALRLPETFTTGLRVLASNATAHGDMLFSFPGLLSFHLWTNLPPPTSANTTHWFNLLSAAQQEEIRARLDADPRACVILQRNLRDFLARTHVPLSSPLVTWLEANYEPAFAMETYEFWVRKGRKIAPLSTATVFESTTAGQPRYRIKLTLAALALKNISAIEFGRFDGDRSTLIKTWTNADAMLVVTRINSTGADTGPQQRVTFPFDLAGLARIDLLVDQLPPHSPLDRCILYLRDATGARVAELRFIE